MPIREIESTTAVPTTIEKVSDKVYSVDYDNDRVVEIGESKEAKFKPTLYFKHWDAECWLKVVPRGNYELNTPIETKDGLDITKIEIADDDGNEKIECYPVDKDDYQDEGGFEFETVLQKKPISNEVIYDFTCSTNIRFIYQPPFNSHTGRDLEDLEATGIVAATRTETTGYDKEGKVLFNMPERAVGSYALYRLNTSRMYLEGGSDEKYKTGKLMHIWRPKIIDNKGSEVWGELFIDDDKQFIKVTIPQDFLDKAAYPVRVDPTFGYTTLGASTYTIEDLINGHVGNPGESGNATTFHAGLHSDWDNGDNVKMALYDSSENLVSPQSEILSAGHGSAAFVSFNPTSGVVSVSDQEYAIMVWADSAVNMRVDYSGSLGDSKFYSETYGTWPASPILSNWAWEFSSYMTYTTSSIPTITNADDEDFHPDEENINVDGTGFEASQGTGKIELGNASTYAASTTKVSQTVNSWGDTQINIDIVQGALSEGNLWLYVTNNGGLTNASGYQVSVTTPTPTITNAGDEDFYNGEENVIVDGTDFGSPQKSGKIELGNANTYAGSTTKVTQTINSWSDTQLDIDVVQGALSNGNAWLYVTHDSGDTSAGYAVTLSAAPTEEIFITPGADTFTVPAGIYSIRFYIWAGGAGGGGGGTVSTGGDGAGAGYVSGTLAVTPGDILDLHIGGAGGLGSFGGTYSGDGGGGGGDSWLLDDSDVLMAKAGAGGGGGGGDNSSATAGGDGGEGGGTNANSGGSSGGAGGGGGGQGGTGGTAGTGGETNGLAGQGSGGTPAGGGGDGGYGVGTGNGGTGGTTNGGDGGEGDNGDGFAGGGGGGAGYAGGGGGSASASGGDAAGGGGGGSNYLAGSVTHSSNQQATGQTPPATGIAQYAGGAGVGGDGGATSSAGTAGANGRIVIQWNSFQHKVHGVDTGDLDSIHGVTMQNVYKVHGVNG